MTDETKELFDAPYKVVETRNGYNVICTNKLIPQLCWTTGEKDAARLARLPELYDALFDEIRAKCNTCIHDNIQLGNVPFVINFNTIQNGCPFKDRQCHTVKHLELLRKVRDGE